MRASRGCFRLNIRRRTHEGTLGDIRHSGTGWHTHCGIIPAGLVAACFNSLVHNVVVNSHGQNAETKGCKWRKRTRKTYQFGRIPGQAWRTIPVTRRCRRRSRCHRRLPPLAAHRVQATKQVHQPKAQGRTHPGGSRQERWTGGLRCQPGRRM